MANILMVGPGEAEQGGMATVIKNFKTHYKDREHTIYYLTSWTKKRKWVTQLKSFLTIRKLVVKYNISIVHFHVAQRGSFFRKILLQRLLPQKCRVVFHMHASQFDVFYKGQPAWLKKCICRWLTGIDQLVVLSGNWREFYEQLTSAKISVIENAVQIPKESFYDSQSTNIICFGRVGKRKGSYDLLEVAERIYPLFPEVRFLLYGDGELESIQRIINKKKLSHVFVKGWLEQTEQEAVFRTSLLHFLPSYHEGLPMAILESMAAGIPNLTTTVGGIPELIKNGESGLLAEPGDIDDLTEKIISFLSDEALRQKLSVNGRAAMLAHYSLDKYFQRWDELYLEEVQI